MQRDDWMPSGQPSQAGDYPFALKCPNMATTRPDVAGPSPQTVSFSATTTMEFLDLISSIKMISSIDVSNKNSSRPLHFLKSFHVIKPRTAPFPRSKSSHPWVARTLGTIQGLVVVALREVHLANTQRSSLTRSYWVPILAPVQLPVLLCPHPPKSGHVRSLHLKGVLRKFQTS